MVLWLVRQRNVTVIRRRPPVRDVTGVAFLCGTEVPRFLADGCYAIVTGRTRAKHLGVIDCHHGHKCIRRVAVFTDIRCQNVCRIFTGGIRAIVAAETVTGDIYVIEIRG